MTPVDDLVAPTVRVRNSPTEYSFWVAEGDAWIPWSESPLQEQIEAARTAWAAAHPPPDRFFSDLPSGTYLLVDGALEPARAS